MLELQQVQLSFGNKTILQQLSFTLQQGEIACLLGHSGCGKTTALRAIAGFETVGGGQITLNGHTISSENTHTPAHLRGIGMVFQDYALFPHLNVADNIAFGLGKHSPAQRQARVAELLDLIDLAAHANQYPHQLSGGQQQRVALARALAPRPQLILLDEPVAGMSDAETARTAELLNELRGKHSIMVVEHDMGFVTEIARQGIVTVLHEGAVLAQGRMDEVQADERVIEVYLGR